MTPQEWANDQLLRRQARRAESKFRNATEERTWYAVNDIDSGMDRLQEIMDLPDGAACLRAEIQRLSSNATRLVELVTQLSTIEIGEAAE